MRIMTLSWFLVGCLFASHSLASEYEDGVLTSPPASGIQALGSGIQALGSGIQALGDVISQIPSPEQNGSHGLTWDGQYLWVCGAFNSMVYHFDPSDGSVVNSYQSSILSLRGLAFDGTNLWMSSWIDRVIYETNPANGAVLSSFGAPNGEAPDGLTWADGSLWVSGDADIYKVSPANGAVLDSIPSPESDPRGLAWDGQTLWVGFQETSNIYQLDPGSGNVLQSFSSPETFQQGLTFDGQYLWATGNGTNTVYQIDIEFQGETVEISIDIKPGNKRNVIKPHYKGGIWVAILSETDSGSPFDPSSQVDIPTVEFGPDGAKAKRYKVKDINKDGLGDLLLRFKIPETGIAYGDTEASLTGQTFGGVPITGTDSIKTVGWCEKK